MENGEWRQFGEGSVSCEMYDECDELLSLSKRFVGYG